MTFFREYWRTHKYMVIFVGLVEAWAIVMAFLLWLAYAFKSGSIPATFTALVGLAWCLLGMFVGGTVLWQVVKSMRAGTFF